MFAGTLWVISFITTLVAFVNYLLSEPQNFMQQAALAAMTVVYILIPYCLARAFSAIMQIESKKNKNKLVDKLLLELQHLLD